MTHRVSLICLMNEYNVLRLKCGPSNAKNTCGRDLLIKKSLEYVVLLNIWLNFERLALLDLGFH